MSKNVIITNGTGSEELINGSYSVVANVTGYDNTSINPDSINVVPETNSYAFEISANGTLTLHVTNTGDSTGTPIVGATFVRCDASGNEYGTAITTDTNGDAVFNNVPFDTTNAPTIYYKQTASDGDHEFDNTLQSTTMTTDSLTIEVENPTGAVRTFTLRDANYANLPIDAGTLTLTNE